MYPRARTLVLSCLAMVLASAFGCVAAPPRRPTPVPLVLPADPPDTTVVAPLTLVIMPEHLGDALRSIAKGLPSAHAPFRKALSGPGDGITLLMRAFAAYAGFAYPVRFSGADRTRPWVLSSHVLDARYTLPGAMSLAFLERRPPRLFSQLEIPATDPGALFEDLGLITSAFGKPTCGDDGIHWWTIGSAIEVALQKVEGAVIMSAASVHEGGAPYDWVPARPAPEPALEAFAEAGKFPIAAHFRGRLLASAHAADKLSDTERGRQLLAPNIDRSLWLSHVVRYLVHTELMYGLDELDTPEHFIGLAIEKGGIRLSGVAPLAPAVSAAAATVPRGLLPAWVGPEMAARIAWSLDPSSLLAAARPSSDPAFPCRDRMGVVDWATTETTPVDIIHLLLNVPLSGVCLWLARMDSDEPGAGIPTSAALVMVPTGRKARTFHQALTFPADRRISSPGISTGLRNAPLSRRASRVDDVTVVELRQGGDTGKAWDPSDRRPAPADFMLDVQSKTLAKVLPAGLARVWDTLGDITWRGNIIGDAFVGEFLLPLQNQRLATHPPFAVSRPPLARPPWWPAASCLRTALDAIAGALPSMKEYPACDGADCETEPDGMASLGVWGPTVFDAVSARLEEVLSCLAEHPETAPFREDWLKAVLLLQMKVFLAVGEGEDFKPIAARLCERFQVPEACALAK